jgi:hypothetical protein
MPTLTRQRRRARHESRELERELTVILDLAHTWGAVLLLDEADVVLEARTAQDIHRNALMSIFLKLLEYFQGADRGDWTVIPRAAAAILYIHMHRTASQREMCSVAPDWFWFCLLLFTLLRTAPSPSSTNPAPSHYLSTVFHVF